MFLVCIEFSAFDSFAVVLILRIIKSIVLQTVLALTPWHQTTTFSIKKAIAKRWKIYPDLTLIFTALVWINVMRSFPSHTTWEAFHILTLRRSLRRKLWMRRFFDVKESIFFKIGPHWPSPPSDFWYASFGKYRFTPFQISFFSRFYSLFERMKRKKRYLFTRTNL